MVVVVAVVVLLVMEVVVAVVVVVVVVVIVVVEVVVVVVVAVVVLAIATEDKSHIHAQKTQIKRCESGRSALTLLSASKLIHYLAHNCTRWQVTLSSTNYLNASRLIFALCTKLQTVLSQIVQH